MTNAQSMAGIECPKCSHIRAANSPAPEAECPACGIIYAKIDPDRLAQARARARLRNMQTSTTHTIPGHEITANLGIVSAECIFGVNLLKDILAQAVDMTGGRSGTLQSTLRNARQTALNELRAEADAVQADAIIGITLDHRELTGEGRGGMLMVVATGTAVKLSP